MVVSWCICNRFTLRRGLGFFGLESWLCVVAYYWRFLPCTDSALVWKADACMAYAIKEMGIESCNHHKLQPVQPLEFVATEENRDQYLMEVKGLDTFTIEILHSGSCIGQRKLYLGMSLLKYFPVTMVDTLVTVLATASIQGKTLTFENGLKQDFDAIVFAIGYKSSLCNWLEGIAGAAQDAMSVAEDIKSILATIKY
ncbi:hypothetical protein F2Q69_00049275 [Brassica cretica]|uniref:FAD/NAD(P)-binding domain-containing protein n=1 Tax=Brassica cretica TaxID=69181 RepID=A0A8S9PT88_BRACR|nr:hypothetical protein F2Q69_00049275 [Brassica cretica]